MKMRTKGIPVYQYRFVVKRECEEGSIFNEIADYVIDAVEQNGKGIIPYTFRSYRYGDFLYITDIFPSAWDNDPQCFKRILSREGMAVNMRRVSVTCLSIFVSQYIDEDKNAVMVVSGSYGEEEDKSGPSRKLRLYGAFFEPLAEKLNLRVLHIPEMNAFMLMDRRADMPDEQIKNNYAEFKKRQNGGL